MKRRLVFLAVLGTVSLAACGSKTDANEKNFGAAMTHYFDKKGGLCLDTNRWPVDLSEMDLRLQKTMQAGSAHQMAALESAGLVKGVDAEVEGASFNAGIKAKVRRYALTDAARPYMQEKGVDTVGLNGKATVKPIDLCWGKKALDKIVKWEGPMKFGDYQEAGITYTYRIDNVADWAKKPEVQAAFPVVKAILDGVGTKQSRHAVKLTSQGWEAKGLD